VDGQAKVVASGSGLIWIELGADWPGFTRALDDSVSSLSPRGTPPGLSTYWIDVTLDGLKASPTTGEHRIVGGNETEFVVAGENVQARSLYELFETEEMPRQDFEGILRTYREAVITAIGAKRRSSSRATSRNGTPTRSRSRPDAAP
jgi:hypothetical protein